MDSNNMNPNINRRNANNNSMSPRPYNRRNRENETYEENVKLNLHEVEKGFKNMYDSFSKMSRDMEKSSARSVKNIVAINLTASKRMYDQLEKMHESYTKNYITRETVAQNKIAINTMNSQNKVFAELERMHADYLNTYIRNEAVAADKVAKLWGRNSNVSGTDINVNFEGSSNNLETNERLLSTFEDLEKASAEMLENMESMSEGIEDTLRRIDQSNRNRNSHRDEIETNISDMISEGNDDTSNEVRDIGRNINRNQNNTRETVSNILLDIGRQLVGYAIQIVDEFRRAYQDTINETTTASGARGFSGDRSYSEYITYMRNEFIKDRDLFKVVNFKDDVISAIVEVSKQGLIGEVAERKAFSDAITHKLMPWIDTKDEAYVNLFANLNESTMNQLKGQQLLLRETQSGNRLLQSGVINTLISDLAPELVAIDLNTGGAAQLVGDYATLYENMVSQGVSTQDAYSYIKELQSVQKDAYAAYTSGDASKVMTRMFYDQNGGDIMGAAYQFDQVVTGLKDSTGNLSGAVNTLGGLAQSRNGGWEEAGAWRIGMFTNTPLDELHARAAQLADPEEAKKAMEELSKTAEDYISPTEKFQNAVENALSGISDTLKNIPEQVVGAIKTLFGIGSTIAATTGLNSILGGATAGEIAGGAGGTAGEVAAGAGAGTAAVVALGAVDLYAAEELYREMYNTSLGNKKAGNIDDEGHSYLFGLAPGYSSEELFDFAKTESKDLINYFAESGDYDEEVLYKLSSLIEIVETNGNDWNVLSQKQLDQFIDLHDQLASDYDKITGDAVYQRDHISYGMFATWADSLLGKTGLGKYFVRGKKDTSEYNYEDDDSFEDDYGNWEYDGSHANGLSYVPYDGYVAELHEGERVLTAAENIVYQSVLNQRDMYSSYSKGDSSKALSSFSTSNSDAIVAAIREVATEIIRAIKESSSGDRFSNMIKPSGNYDNTIVNLMSPI